MKFQVQKALINNILIVKYKLKQINLEEIIINIFTTQLIIKVMK